jgi:hypothetical protein
MPENMNSVNRIFLAFDVVKRALLTTLFIFPTLLFAQVFDDFSDGDFTNNPVWLGMDTNFVVNGSGELQLDAPPASAESFLVTPNTSLDSVRWEIRCRMDFNPSSSNRAYIYLTSDSMDLRGNLNGYFVLLGNTADEVSLYRQQGNTQTKIIDGVDGVLNFSTVDVKIRVFRDTLGNWTLERDADGLGYVSEGSVQDTFVKNTSWFGVNCDYTSTRSDKFFFDDFSVGRPVGDTLPPQVVNWKPTGSDRFRITFHEWLEPAAAQNASNYTLLSGAAAISQVNLVFPTIVEVVFASNLPQGAQDTLRIENLSDTAGNAMAPYDLVYSFFYPDSAVSGDVIINEFIADPAPPVALPEQEFVELYNRSGKSFQLEDWTFSDASSTVALPEQTLLPGEYIILCDASDSLDFAAYGRVVPLNGMPALNNSGDDIRIEDSFGNVIDELSYTTSWYKDDQKDDGGFSLEKINPDHPCDGESNWTASNSLDGGTPGSQNSVFTTALDSLAPQVRSFEILGEKLFDLEFDEEASFDSIRLWWQWSVPPLGISQELDIDTIIQESGNRYQVQTTSLYRVGSRLSVELFGLEDCVGNRDTVVETTATGITPQLFDVMITEIMAKPDESLSGMPDAEYIEIHNSSQSYVEIGGLILSDQSSSTVLDSFVLAPIGQLVLCSPSDVSLFPGVDALGVSSFPSLNDSEDDISLRNSDSILIHRIDYASEWHGGSTYEEGGYSLEMRTYIYPCGGKENWGTSPEASGGSPGLRNRSWDDYYEPEFAEVLSAVGLDSTTVSCNLSKDIFYSQIIPPNMGNWKILNSDLPIRSFELLDPRTLNISLDEPMETGRLYEVEIENFMMCLTQGIPGFHSHAFPFVLAQEAAEHEVVINEILSNPLYSDGSDFIEIVNASDKYISLKNWEFANTDPEVDTLGTRKVLSATHELLAPGEILAFSEHIEELTQIYPEAVQENLRQVEDLPSYNNSTGTVVLLDGNGQVMDSVFYAEDYHNPLLRDFDGKSLERIDPQASSLDPSNWQTAGEDFGFGTPGARNSQFIERGSATSQVEVSPSVFSPDGDGVDDVLSIAYSLDSDGYIGNLWVLDKTGRKRRQLANNDLLSKEGNFFWNGFDDEGQKMTVGIYVIFLEIFDSSGAVHRFKRAATLGGKL